MLPRPSTPGLASLALFLSALLPSARASEKIVESVLPALAYGPSCSSTVELQNLGDQSAVVEVEAHRAGGGLVPLVGHPEIKVRLEPGARAAYKLQISEETSNAWVKVRETIAAPGLSPAIAVSATVECLQGNRLRAGVREAAYPTRNPWYSGDVSELPGDVLTLINTSEEPARASACYSSGALFSVPTERNPRPPLAPVCNAAVDIQIPPFGTWQFPVERDGSTHFSLKTQGRAVVLQMLRPVDSGVKVYTVDSTIRFGSEVPAAPPGTP